MNQMRTLAALCAGALLAGCAGAGQGPSPLPLANQPSAGALARAAASATTNVRRRKGTLDVRITIPKLHRHSGEAPRFISTATKGMTMAFTGPTTMMQVVNLTPSDPRCKGIPLTCTIAITLLAGSYTVTIDAYDKAPVAGSIPSGAKLLSTAKNAPFTMVAGVTNGIGVTLDGVPASFVVGGLPSGTAGTAFGSPKSFTVTVKDASGDVITGAYENPVTLSDTDATGATTIATSGSDNPPARRLLSSSDAATLTYTGLAIVPATITASASGATNGTGKFAPTLQPIVSAPNVLNLYATSGGGSTETFSASEAGWTNAPFNKKLDLTVPSNCATIATAGPPSGTTFTATVVVTPSVSSCSLTVSDGAGQTHHVALRYETMKQTFDFTGASQTFTVPSLVSQITIQAAGAQGGTGNAGSGLSAAGGEGGTVSATIRVTPGQAFTMNVGGAGVAGSGAGGGASIVTLGSVTIAVAGGGGGGGTGSGNGLASGNCCFAIPGGAGGAGGGLTGLAGGPGLTATVVGNINFACLMGGGGGDTTHGIGGAVGTNSATLPPSDPSDLRITSFSAGATAGGFESGGVGINNGSGGVGYYGGGGGGGAVCSSLSYGAGATSGGGGGSAFAEPSATSVTYTTGTQAGNGQVGVSY